MAKACCRKKGSGGSSFTCQIESGTNFTFVITVAQGVDAYGSTVYGYSDGQGTDATNVFGSLDTVLDKLTGSEINYFASDGGSFYFNGKDNSGALIDNIITLYIDGVLFDGSQSFGPSDVGSQKCISVDINTGG